jgi:3-deoxy-manno-octulosonate cytidylyltransferase (CMP-KDO synthetase)
MKKEHEYQFAGIIPARYASARFPGKPLVMIGDKSMVQRVYEQAQKSIDIVYIATDDYSADHQSGTDRCAEAVDKIMQETGKRIDIVVNIQGDEPFIRPEQIDLLKSCFNDKNVQIATLIRKTTPGEDIFNPNQPKVILDSDGNAIYFSRTAIPYIRDANPSEWSVKHIYYKHLGLYAYNTDVLKKITKLSRSALEIAESLEQNRWIENGFKIRCTATEWKSIGVDTPEDLKRAILFLDNFI